MPACKTCNTTKGEWDVEKDGDIVNPLVDNPQDYLFVNAFRYYAKNNNKKGKDTITELNLNNTDQFTKPRFEIYSRIIDTLRDNVEKLCSDDTPRKQKNT